VVAGFVLVRNGAGNLTPFGIEFWIGLEGTNELIMFLDVDDVKEVVYGVIPLIVDFDHANGITVEFTFLGFGESGIGGGGGG